MTGTIRSGARAIAREAVLERAARAAGGLEALRVGEGDAVALLLRNDFPFLEATLAARLRGAYAVPLNWHATGEEAAYILRDCGARVLVVHADLLPALQGHLLPGVRVLVVETPPEIREAYGLEPAACGVPPGAEGWDAWVAASAPLAAPAPRAPQSMIYTSGTTGRPKGVRRAPATPAQAEHMLAKYRALFGIHPGMRAIVPAPLYHSAPNAFALYSMLTGGDVLLLPRFAPEPFLEQVARHRITHVQMVPIMFIRLLRLPEPVRRRYDLSSLEYVLHAAAPCPAGVKQAMLDWWGPVIHEYYGATESGAITLSDSADWLARPGTVGRPMEECVVRILDDEGRALPAGEAGEIFMRDRSLPEFTYHGHDAKRREMERDGLITCGDMGYLDTEGYLFLCDRKIDMVISGGVNIYPAEIEAVLLRHPGVRDCAVFGIPDEEYGEALAAFVQPALMETDGGAPAEAEALRAWLREHLAAFKVPRLIEVRADLPREDSGKIFKRKLRDPFWAGRERAI